MPANQPSSPPGAAEQRDRSAPEVRRTTVQTLARWCYEHGVTGLALRAASADQQSAICAAALVPPVGDETWGQVREMLARRILWDQEHHRSAPPLRACLDCILAQSDLCWRHRAGTCTACRLPLHVMFLNEGHRTHPACDPDAVALERGGPAST